MCPASLFYAWNLAVPVRGWSRERRKTKAQPSLAGPEDRTYSAKDVPGLGTRSTIDLGIVSLVQAY